MPPPPPQPDPNDTPEVAELKRQLYLVHFKIALLEGKLRLVRLRRYGAAAEKLSPEQLALFQEELGASEVEVLAEAGRHGLRQQRAPVVLAEVRCQIERAHQEVLPASVLGRAVTYALAQWPKLVRFLEYPELELSNNLAENAIRPVALGRKNWLHFSSPEAGPKIAAILSVVETCPRSRIDLRAYLLDVLPRLADTSIRKVAELTPTAWSAQRG